MLINKTNILLPNKNIDLSKWSVIACDQFTSDKNYWLDLEKYINKEPSTLSLIIPEAFMETKDYRECNKALNCLIENNVFDTIKDSYILINRKTPYHKQRLGLVCAIDLEQYEYNADSKSLIRASEGTLQERVLPRIKVRENLVAEFPHIMLLFDDRKEQILENLYKNKDNFEKLYDFELNGNGGHLEGYKIQSVDLEEEFRKLLDKDYLEKVFNTQEELLFIVGDGNHSLATAKTCWNEIKNSLTENERQNHIARFCLVEVCNINDDGIEFYPIHRVVYNFGQDCTSGLKNLYKGKDFVEYKIVYDGKEEKLKLPRNTTKAIKLVQEYLEEYKSRNTNIEIDYIHDEKNVLNECENNNALGIFLPSLDKKEIFQYVIQNGPLPKKSFSIGKSIEKRYYLEGRIIKK